MELRTMRGGSRAELKAGCYTIGIGISLGNKWFTTENITELVRWALPLSKDRVIVYVADSIHAINLEARNRTSFANALKKALLLGDDILGRTRSRIEQELSPEEASRVVYVKWDEISDDSYKRKVEFLRDFFQTNLDFRNAIRLVVQNFIAKEGRTFPDEKINRLCQYILEEFPELINRVPMNGFTCDAYIYPFDGELTRLAEKIQGGELFTEIKDCIMDTEPKVFLEVR
jgi:tRNA-dependent cyclodipeptide synthase